MNDNASGIPWLRTRLSVLMFLQFAIWGAWVPVLGNHLGDLKCTPEQVGMVYLTGALATMISPLIAGQIADRWFATQKFIGVSFLISGAFFFWAARVNSYAEIWWLALAAMLFFSPTLGLANAISFHHLKDARKDFPIVRLFGTVGWIAAGFILSGWLKYGEGSFRDALVLGGIFAVLCGAYSFTLPRTLPRAESAEKFAVGKVLRMLSDPSFALFTLVAFALLVFGTFYYNFAGLYFGNGLGLTADQVPLVLLCGQVMEILTMLVLPFMLRKLGMRWTITLGILAWAARFFLFSLLEPVSLMIAAQVLHGACFAFAVAAAMIYVERISAPDVRGSAQSFLAFATYGVGMFVGSLVSGGVVGERYHVTDTKLQQWTPYWQVPAIGCLVLAIVFGLFFPRARHGAGTGGLGPGADRRRRARTARADRQLTFAP